MPDDHIANAKELAALKVGVANLSDDVGSMDKKLDQLFEIQRQVAFLQQEMVNNTDTFKRAFARIEVNERESQTTKQLTERWINRGIGAWFVGALLVTIIQMMLSDRVGTYESAQRNQADQLVTLDRRLSWAEYELKLKENKGGVK